MAAARRPPILAVPPDDREPLTRADVDAACEAYTRELFARAGQLAMPGAPAQLGLDGVAYAPELHPPIEDPAPAGSSLSLATYVEFRCEGDLPPTDGNAPSALPGQLAFPDDWHETTAQRPLWSSDVTEGRMDLRHDMLKAPRDCDPRERKRRGLPPRCECHPFAPLAKCLKVRYETDAAIEWKRTERGAWIPSGMVTCGNVWCPSCGPRKCRDTASWLAIAFAEFFRGNPELTMWRDLWMLTLKIPHYIDDNPSAVVAGLHDAAEKFQRSSVFRKWRERWGIKAHVRVLDVTFGGRNGVHPHFHVALFVEHASISVEHAWSLEEHRKEDDQLVVDERGSMDCNGVKVETRAMSTLDDELERWRGWLYRKPLRICSETVRKKFLREVKGSLIEAWEQAVRASGVRIEDDAHFRSNSLDLQPGENAAHYFTKWGLENEVGSPSIKSRGVLRLLDAVGVIPGAAWTYKQWLGATKHRALVVGLTDAMRRLWPLQRAGVNGPWAKDETSGEWSERIDELARAHLAEQTRRREAELERAGTPVKKVQPVSFVVRSHLYTSALAIGWGKLQAFVDKVTEPGRGYTPDWVQREVDDFLWRNLPVGRGPPDG